MFNHDWNCNGKIDSGDRFIDYMIISDSPEGNNQEDTHSNGSSCGDGILLLGIGLLIFGVLMLAAIII